MAKDLDLQFDLELVSTNDLAKELLSRTGVGFCLYLPRGEKVETIWTKGNVTPLLLSYIEDEEEKEAEDDEEREDKDKEKGGKK